MVDQSFEKIYAINSRRRNSAGEEYIYKNYEVFIPYEYLEYAGITDHLYLYLFKDKVYMTSARPDGTVPAKKLSVHKQRGSPNSRKFQPERTKNNKWKRFFIIPKKFFPYATEDQQVVFTLDIALKDIFSDNATITMDVVDIDE